MGLEDPVCLGQVFAELVFFLPPLLSFSFYFILSSFLITLKISTTPDIVALACNISTLEAEAGLP